MTAAHVNRPADKRAKAAPPTLAKAYPVGFFTQLVRDHKWPPSFESQFSAAGRDSAALSLRAQQQRQDGSNAWESMPLNLPGAVEHLARWKVKA
jgi:hypothetical protein